MATAARAMATRTKRAKKTDGEGNCDGGKCDGNGNEEGDGKSSKSDGDGIEEGIDCGCKSNGDGVKEGNGEGGKGDGDSNKGVKQGMATATKRAMGSAMTTATRVADAKESTGNGDCNCDSD
jgi:hypothetical protein